MSELISRQDAIDACHNWDDGENAYAYGDIVIERLQALPSAERKGEWINTRQSDMSDNIVCSKCGYDSIAEYLFCPNCGARMCERKEDEHGDIN